MTFPSLNPSFRRLSIVVFFWLGLLFCGISGNCFDFFYDFDRLLPVELSFVFIVLFSIYWSTSSVFFTSFLFRDSHPRSPHVAHLNGFAINWRSWKQNWKSVELEPVHPFDISTCRIEMIKRMVMGQNCWKRVPPRPLTTMFRKASLKLRTVEPLEPFKNNPTNRVPLCDLFSTLGKIMLYHH